MRTHSAMLGAAAAPSPLLSWMTGRGPGVSFHAGASLAPSGRYVARFIEILIFGMLLALIALPAPARAQTITISSMTASPGHRPARTNGCFHRHDDRQSERLELSCRIFVVGPWRPPGNNTTQQVFSETFKAGAALIQTYSWTVPAGTKAGAYTLYVAVFNPTWSAKLAQKSTALTITAASAPGAAAPSISSRRWSAARPRSARSSRQRPEPGRAQLPTPISGPGIKRKSRERRRRPTPLFQPMPDTR